MNLKKYLALLSQVNQENRERQANFPLFYSGAAEFLLLHAHFYAVTPYPKIPEHGAPRSCFGNSIMFAAVKGWKYIEGYAVEPTLQTPIHHAWNVTPKEGRLIDTTWRNSGIAYFGVEFSPERAIRATWDRDSAVLDDWQSGFEVLRQQWEGETPQEPHPIIEMLRKGQIGEVRLRLLKEAHQLTRVRERR